MEKDNSTFKKYRQKLIIEGFIKASIFGLMVGFGASIIPAVITFIINKPALLISALIGSGVFLISTPLIYLLFFQPTTLQIARRVDRLGLEERYITMLELQNDNSFIAMKQREDAKQKLGSFDKKMAFMLSMSVGVFIALGIIIAGSTTAITLAEKSVDPKLLWTNPGHYQEQIDFDYVRISYIIESSDDGFPGGVLVGDTEQLVIRGENSSAVTAVADIGYVFDSWDDGWNSPTRADMVPLKIDKESIADKEPIADEPIIYKAKFIMLDLTKESEGDGKKEAPVPGEPDEEGERELQEDKDARYLYGNQFYDERTYYKDSIQEAYDEAMRMIAEGGEIPTYLREIIETYYNFIMK